MTERPFTEKIVCNTELWASCIGGAAHETTYQEAIAAAGLVVEEIRGNDYQFISRRARAASDIYGVKSQSIRARLV